MHNTEEMMEFKDYKCLNCNTFITANELTHCPICDSANLLEQARIPYSEQAKNGKRWCYDCTNYYKSTACGYNSSYCKIYGSLDADQDKRHPDKTADICEDYIERFGPKWYEKEK